MLFLTRQFSALVGDLVPKDNNFWEHNLTFGQILHLVTAKTFQIECRQTLKDLASENNRVFLQLSKKHSSYKEHLLTHYPKIFLLSGPLSLFSS